ncbi:MAG: triose-phosphate isomerase [Gammaproteobacteria bacterium]
MTNRRPLVAANWKMHGDRASVAALLEGFKSGVTKNSPEMVVCPPAIYIPLVAECLSGSGIAIGAQNVSQHESGAHTGEIAAAMLRDYGCDYVIIGHSERRHRYGEDNDTVAKKFRFAGACGIKPILCLGEQQAERRAGNTEQVLAEQLDAVIKLAGIEAFTGAVIAYEPVWAIGTGLTATPEQAQAAHNFIRLQLARHADDVANELQILYGGSVKPDNAAEIFAMADVDGGLIGGASLKVDDFLAICQAAR